MKYLVWINLLLCPLWLSSQIKLERSFEVDGDHLNISSNGTLWVWSDFRITTYSAVGEELQNNSLQYYGDIATIDLRNPLKPLLFFPDQNQILFLDNRIAARGNPIALDILGYPYVLAACTSYNNAYWIYDAINQRLVRLDAQGQESHQSAFLPQLMRDQVSISQMVEGKNWLYALTDKGIARFDLFGAYQNTVRLDDAKKVGYYDNQLWVYTGSKLVVLDQVGSWKEYELPDDEWLDFAIFDKSLYLLKQNLVEIYTFAD